VGVLVSVVSGDPAGSRGESTRSGAQPGSDPSPGPTAGGRRVAGAVGAFTRCVSRGAGTAAGCGCDPVASSAGALGTVALGSTGLGIGRTADGSTDDAGPPAAGVTGASELTGAGGLTGTADTVGTGTAGASEWSRAVMSSTATAPPVSARHPPAAASLPQRCRPWAWRRNASQGSSSASGGLSAGGSVGSGACWGCGVWNKGAALATFAGAARSAPIRSRRARSSSIARI
jgi:hypothetical protein